MAQVCGHFVVQDLQAVRIQPVIGSLSEIRTSQSWMVMSEANIDQHKRQTTDDDGD